MLKCIEIFHQENTIHFLVFSDRNYKDISLASKSVYLIPILFLFGFYIYISTLNPAFLADDSPETITASVTLGIQHPPGYPLHALCGHLFNMIPIGDPSFRINMMSSIFSLLCFSVMAFFCRVFLSSFGENKNNTNKDYWTFINTSVVGSFLVLVFSNTFWGDSLSAKGGIYTLQCFILSCCLVFLPYDIRESISNRQNTAYAPNKNSLFLFIFFLGLGLANHWPIQIIFTLSLLPLIKSIPTLKKAVQSAVFLSLSLSPYLYLPLRCRLNPFLNLGDPITFHNFAKVLSRSYYKNQESNLIQQIFYNKTAYPFADLLSYCGKYPTREFSPLIIIIFSVGIYFLIRKVRKNILLLLVPILAFIFSPILFVNSPTHLFWTLDNFLLPIDLFISVLFGLGLFFLLITIKKQIIEQRRFSKWSKSIGGLLLIALLFPSITSDYFDHNRSNDQKSQYWAYDYSLNLLKTMKFHSVFFAEGDIDYFGQYYLKTVENRRPDNILIPTFLLFEPWGLKICQNQGLLSYKEQFVPTGTIPQTLIQKNLQGIITNNSRSIYFSESGNLFNLYFLQYHSNGSIFPSGLTYEYLFPGKNTWKLNIDKALNSFRIRDIQSSLMDSRVVSLTLRENYSTAYWASANFLRDNGIRSLDPFFGNAIILTRDHSKASKIWNDWGIYLARSRQWGRATKAFENSENEQINQQALTNWIKVEQDRGAENNALDLINSFSELFPSLKKLSSRSDAPNEKR
jgi:hypothetical protein